MLTDTKKNIFILRLLAIIFVAAFIFMGLAFAKQDKAPFVCGEFELAWDGTGSGQGGFSAPRGIDVDMKGNVYVADTGNDRIQKFDSDGNYIATIGTPGSGDGEIDEPYDVAVGNDGKIYVAETVNNRIQVLNANGTFHSKIVSDNFPGGDLNFPWGVGVDKRGNVYFTRAVSASFLKFDKHGNFLAEFDAGSNARGLEITPQGTIYLGGFALGELRILSPEGDIIEILDSDEGLDFPIDVAIGQFNRLNVIGGSSSFFQRVWQFDKSLNLLNEWGTGGTGDGEFMFAEGIAADQHGNIYVADTGNDRVQKFSCSLDKP